MNFAPQTRFSMCSLYSRHHRAICACFKAKDKEVVEELVALHSEALLWSGAGSGVISLADLESELKGKRVWDPQGGNDLEFLKLCHERGIKVFGVVFTAQGYEVAVELNDEESEIVSFGKISGKGKGGTWGLNEFYQGRYPKLYPSWRNYFSPEKVALMEKALAQQSFLEQAACQDLDGNKSLCYWVNSSDLPQDFQYTNYFMCQNSPLWREHLKRIIEMQIDAGFDGIQFDEPALAMEPGGTRAGFCEHCQERFHNYMLGRYGEKVRNLDYRKLLKKKGAGIPSELVYFRGLPFWQDWKRFLLISARKNFAELANHARDYGKSKGKEIPVATNFAFFFPDHLALAEYVDIFSLEYHPTIPPAGTNIIYPDIGIALDEKKPLTMVPDIAFATFLRERAKATKPDGTRKDVNLLRYLIAEASFAGGDFMVPYSCLCLTGEGAYFPPVSEISGYLKFVKELREKWRNAQNFSQATIVLSFPSYFWTHDFLNLPGPHFSSLSAIVHFLQNLGIQYRLIIWGDDEFLRDRGELAQNELLILPNVSHITDGQMEKLRVFLKGGGKALALGKFAVRDQLNQKRTPLPFSSQELVQIHILDSIAEIGLKPQIYVKLPTGLAPLLKIGESKGKLLIKILNRNYNYPEDAFNPVQNAELVIEKSVAFAPKAFRMFFPGGEPIEIRGKVFEKEIRFQLPEIQIYACLEEID